MVQPSIPAVCMQFWSWGLQEVRKYIHWLEEVKYVGGGERRERERERHLMEVIYHPCLVKISQCGGFGVPHSCKPPLVCVP